MADVVPVPRFTARWLTIISAPVTIAAVLAAAPACQADWAYGRYLYRYFVWGPHQLAISGVDDYKLFPYRTIDNGLPAFYFRTGPADTIPARVEYKDGETVKAAGLEELLKSTSTHAFIVIKDDKLLYEHYFNGYQRDSICVSMSMAKSVTSALVGIAIDEGLIRSVNDPLTDYIPELKERGFGAITIRHLLTMGSGIKFTEHAIDFVWSDDALAYFHPYLRERLLSDLTIVEPPGEAFHYNSYNPELLGLILERTTRRSPSQYLEEKVWKPLGMEYPATWSIDSVEDGFELMQSALNARAIDFAKLGKLFLNKGDWNGRRIISQRWVEESTAPDPDDHRDWETSPEWHDGGGYYKYAWWGVSMPGGHYAFMAIGKYGQFIYVYPARKVVIVRTAAKYGLSPLEWRQIFQYVAEHLG